MLFPASNSLAVPSQYRLVISQNASAAFQSDPVFYQQFGPVTVATSAASEGFNVVLPPPSQVSFPLQHFFLHFEWFDSFGDFCCQNSEVIFNQAGTCALP